MLSGVLMYRTGEFLVLYIRNIIPLGTRLPRRRSCALWAGLTLNFAITEF